MHICHLSRPPYESYTPPSLRTTVLDVIDVVLQVDENELAILK